MATPVLAVAEQFIVRTWTKHYSPFLLQANSLRTRARILSPASNCLKTKVISVVEAVGVEPTSENVTGQEPTYLVAFARRSYPPLSRPALRTDKKRKTLARISYRRSPDVGPPASLLCDALPQPADKAAEDGYLKLSSVC